MPEFNVFYFRTFSYIENFTTPQTKLFGDSDSLDLYIEENENKYDFSAFINLKRKYDDSFFESGSLIFIVTQETSGGTRHTISSIKLEDKKLTVNIHRELGMTCDMAGWHIVLEVCVPAKEIETIAYKFSIISNNGRYF